MSENEIVDVSLSSNDVSLSSNLEDSAIVSEVNQALEQRDHADYACFQMLDRLLSEIPSDDLAKLFVKSTLLDLEEAHEFLDECQEVLQQRKDANQRFLISLARKR